MADFHLEEEGIERLQKAMADYGEGVGQKIYEYLSTTGDEIFQASITNLIPVSDRAKKHAKHSNPLKSEMQTETTLYIHAPGKYHYLYFPDQGQGTSKGQAPHEFMETGVDNRYNQVVNDLIDILIKDLNNL